jgi:hypothetical protein
VAHSWTYYDNPGPIGMAILSAGLDIRWISDRSDSDSDTESRLEGGE